MTNHHYHYDNTTTTTKTTTTGTSTTSSTGARARSVVGISPDVLHGWYLDCCAYYADSFRREPAPVIRRDIAEAIRAGMTGELLHAIMDETQTAPRPSWAYCRAIIARAKRDGILTMADWQQDKQRREASRNPALNYQQRQYIDDDYGPDFFVDLSKYA